MVSLQQALRKYYEHKYEQIGEAVEVRIGQEPFPFYGKGWCESASPIVARLGESSRSRRMHRDREMRCQFPRSGSSLKSPAGHASV